MTNDELDLRLHARDAIKRHLLPPRRPDNTWGGPGNGTDCKICKKQLSPDEMVLELEFAAEDRTADVCARCPTQER